MSLHGDRTRGRLPRGPHGLKPEEVAADQRERLTEAMVHLAGERGYAATTVGDLIERAEVSRKTFYAHFADRRDLLLAAFDATSPAALKELTAATRRSGGATRQLESLTGRLCRLARESPGTIALSTVEIAAVEPDGLERRDRLIGDYGELVDCCLRGDSPMPALPPTVARALAGGAFRSVDAAIRAGRTGELKSLAAQLARWTRLHHPVPPTLTNRPNGGSASKATASLVGGRAPGTLAIAPGDHESLIGRPSRGFMSHLNRERILDAVAQLTAANGYTALTAQGIAEHADLSERAFLAHFKNKDDAFVAAVELGHAKGQAIVDRARASESDWRTGVRYAIEALLDFFASEPCFTRLAFVDAPLAGPAMARRVHEHAAAYARLLLDGAPQRRRPPRIAPEAATQGLFEIAFHHAARRKVAELPGVAHEACYLALAPFVGVSEAAQTAVAA
ncbi:MAG TPA: TetR/AcrR family transcriptional regulator [Solirubrobacteraceae bacterium]